MDNDKSSLDYLYSRFVTSHQKLRVLIGRLIVGYKGLDQLVRGVNKEEDVQIEISRINSERE